MAPLSSPYTSGQNRTSSRRLPLSTPICDPPFTQHPDGDRRPDSRWVFAGSEANLDLQQAGAPPIAMGTTPQLPQIHSPSPEDPMTRLQAEQLPPCVEDMQVPYLGGIFPHYQVSFSLPSHDVMYLSNDPDTYTFGLGTLHPPPFFGGVEHMQDHMAHINTTYQEMSYNYTGNTPTNAPFYSEDYSWSPVAASVPSGQAVRGPVPPSASAPRTLGAGKRHDGMRKAVKRHEACPATPETYLLSPTPSAHTSLTSVCSPSSSSLSPQSPISERANNGQNIRIIDLYYKWRDGRTDPFTAADLPSLRAYCKSELIRQGYQDVPRLFRKQPKALVGTPESRRDRLDKRHNQTADIFYCPVVGCESQCTRKHNLNLHLAAHVGLTDRYCDRCDNYFSRSSIERHRRTCSGKKSQRPRRGYGVGGFERN